MNVLVIYSNQGYQANNKHLMPPTFFSDDLPKPKTTELLEKGVESVHPYSASEERDEGRRWRVFRIGDQEHKVDMTAIEPYKRVISHGGQCVGHMPTTAHDKLSCLGHSLFKVEMSAP